MTASHAADLENGDIVIGDCGTFPITHVDVETGEQHPFGLGFADLIAYLENGDLLVLDQIGTRLWLVRLTPDTGAHRVIADLLRRTC